ncbi:MAG TPA: VOC family protein [Gemmatimonadaceae bacterium]|nr:VOC family protein [Gemmatimonadaceae bacterium]
MDRRHFLTALPALALAPHVAAQAAPASLKVRGLSQLTLTVSDVARSLKFYQDIFGMPIQARQGTTLFLRIGNGPQFLALKQAAAGERPSISAFGMGVDDFSVDRVVRVLAEHGVSRAAGTDGAFQPMTVRVVPRPGHTAASGPPPADVYVADPSGIVFQLHDPGYCGGGGTNGTDCRTVEASPAKGLLAVRDMSHFTVGVSDQPKTVAFYQGLVGADIQSYQGTAPSYGIGPGVHFLMFIGGGPGRGGAPPAAPRIDHACMAMTGFDPAAVTKTLTGYGLKPMPNASREPLVTYISLRMPNRGGADGGTPELYLTDPDGLAIQLQDVTYCGGAGFQGDVCPANPVPNAR